MKVLANFWKGSHEDGEDLGPADLSAAKGTLTSEDDNLSGAIKTSIGEFSVTGKMMENTMQVTLKRGSRSVEITLNKDTEMSHSSLWKGEFIFLQTTMSTIVIITEE